MSSPAQATSAERVLQHHVPQQPSSTYPPGEDTRLRFNRRRSSSGRQTDNAYSATVTEHNSACRVNNLVDSNSRDSFVQRNRLLGAGPIISEPRVVLENILLDKRVGHIDLENVPQNKKKASGPVVLLEPLDSAVSIPFFI